MKKRWRLPSFLLLCAAILSAGASLAQRPAPRDVPYPGAIRLIVDATDTERHIFRVRETIPVRPGQPIVLLYPQWLPGNHAPAGRVDKLAGLTIRAGRERVAWTRDPIDVHAFRVEAPPDATSLEVEFQFLSPVEPDQGRVVMTPEMLNLQWNAVVLYPAGHFARQITVAPTLQLPDGWQAATALETASVRGGVVEFKPASLETLVDSPVFAGRHFRRFDLGSAGGAPVRLNVVADRPHLLETTDAQIAAHRELVRQADLLFGSHHFDHYDFLLALTDRMGGIGLEHHQSSENATAPTYFTEWDRNAETRDLLPHEYVHSWNGKFRRPADLWTPNFNVPMRDTLLWVYEGQTQYWGAVLAARSGLWTKQEALDELAMIAAAYEMRTGRGWRPLQDTTNDPIIAMRRSLPWRSWQRSEDYYAEGLLIWLEVDTLIRELSGGARSMDDFARSFFGVNDGSYVPVTYTFEDVVRTLESVQPYDWGKLLRARLDSNESTAPLDGIRRGGYKLAYTETPSAYFKASETRRRVTDLTYSIGVVVGSEGRLTDVLWQGPAYEKGLTLGNQIVAVNGTAYNADLLKQAIQDARSTGSVELLVKDGDRYRTVRLDYRGGLRYPHLERDSAIPARLDQILAPRG